MRGFYSLSSVTSVGKAFEVKVKQEYVDEGGMGGEIGCIGGGSLVGMKVTNTNPVSYNSPAFHGCKIIMPAVKLYDSVYSQLFYLTAPG